MVEFALVAPLFFLLLTSLIVGAIVVMNQVQLNNAVRDGARSAAICGGPQGSGRVLPNGAACSSSALIAYIGGRLNAVPGGAAISVCSYSSGNVVTSSCSSSGDALLGCNLGKTVEVDASYAQPLYLPLVGNWLGTNGGSTRQLNASAEAVCEQ